MTSNSFFVASISDFIWGVRGRKKGWRADSGVRSDALNFAGLWSGWLPLGGITNISPASCDGLLGHRLYFGCGIRSYDWTRVSTVRSSLGVQLGHSKCSNLRA